MHVVPVPPSRAGYVAKYLRKRARPECFKAVRLWAKFGEFLATRVVDVRVESNWTRTYAVLASTVGKTFIAMKWWQRGQAVDNVERERPWWFGIMPREAVGCG